MEIEHIQDQLFFQNHPEILLAVYEGTTVLGNSLKDLNNWQKQDYVSNKLYQIGKQESCVGYNGTGEDLSKYKVLGVLPTYFVGMFFFLLLSFIYSLLKTRTMIKRHALWNLMVSGH